MERRYNVEFKNSGVSDVAVRHDNKIMASGGWDGRYLTILTNLTT